VRQLGVRLGIGLVVALIATGATLGAPAYARSHHHRHHHHAAGGGGTPTPVAAVNACAATPQTATMNLLGAFSSSVSCHGLAPLETITIDSLLLRGNCAGLNINGLVPPIAVVTDGAGNLSMNIAGFNCLAGSYSVQGVGPIDNIDFPIALTF